MYFLMTIVHIINYFKITRIICYYFFQRFYFRPWDLEEEAYYTMYFYFIFFYNYKTNTNIIIFFFKQ